MGRPRKAWIEEVRNTSEKRGIKKRQKIVMGIMKKRLREI